MTFMWPLRGISVIDTYMAVTCEVDIAVGCVPGNVYKMLGLDGHLV